MTDNRPVMTDRIFMATLSRIPAGEYYFGDLNEVYMEATPKSYRDLRTWEGSTRKKMFFYWLEEKKYGLAYLTKGRIEYIGTNDCNTLMVRW